VIRNVNEFILADEQQKIIDHYGAPLRVLAGPGTGKTFCIIEKIKDLIIRKNISNNNICAVTFTNSASEELRERLEKSGIRHDILPYSNTLHGMGMGILRNNLTRAGLKPGFRPVDSITQRILVRDTVQDLKYKKINLTQKEIQIYIKSYYQKKSQAGIPPVISNNPQQKERLEIFSKYYCDTLDFYNVIDWTDILIKAIYLIDYYEDIKEKIHERTKYLLVDEYQDFSPLEQNFIDKICGNENGLFIVGDEDQSIYETFRFADPQGIINLTNKYKNLKSLSLTLCRRCSPEVISCALKLIENNRRRVSGKKLKPFDKNKKGFVAILPLRSKKAEIEWIVKKVLKLVNQKGYSYKDFMILFTDSKMAKDYIDTFKKSNVPLDIQLKVSNVFSTKYFIWLISTIKFLANNNDNLSLRQCLDYWRGIGSETVRQLRLSAIANKTNLWEVINNLVNNPNAFEGMRQRNKVIAFFKYFSTIKNSKNFSDIAKNFFFTFPECKKDTGCKMLFGHLKKFDGKENIITIEDVMGDFEQQIESGELENKYKKEQGGIRIMTMHSAKGCESPVVFIPALEDDIMPGQYVENIEEQRRLFYVSLTRAKIGVFLTWAKQRTGQEIHIYGRRMLGKNKSRFLIEIEQ